MKLSLRLVLAAGLACACAAPSRSPEARRDPPGLFRDATAETGLAFVHESGRAGGLTILEIMGAGAALVDYDADGDLDAYLVQGGPLPGATPGAKPQGDRLFRNELVETGRLRFREVTAEAGLAPAGYGMGVATGDYDGDGRVDLYVTRHGSNSLLRNRGEGRFEDVTARAGADDPRWSTSAAFLDFDADGALDLYVVNYLDFAPRGAEPCRAPSTAPDYCAPSRYPPLPDRLLRNRGDGRFEDVSRTSGIAALPGSGLGVVAADLDRDGRTDLYVANDAMANRLWINRGGGRFADEAAFAGCAFNREGRAEAGMGVDAGDVDGDGDLDLFVTHLSNETNTLYLADGAGLFDDASLASGLGPPSLPFTSFGTLFFDYDSDGRLDLLVVSGEVHRIEAQVRAGEALPLKQTKQLFRNRDGRRFEDVSAKGGPAFERLEVGRGAAFGDVDEDGDTDVLVTTNDGPAQLLLNEATPQGSWLGLSLVDERGRDGLGAEVTVALPGGARLLSRVHTDGGYLSAHDPRVRVGLGAATRVESVTARWPDGRIESWSGVPLGRYTTLVRGTGNQREKAEKEATEAQRHRER